MTTGDTIIKKIKRNEPLTDKELQYARQWYENLRAEAVRQEEEANRRIWAQHDLDILCRINGSVANKVQRFREMEGREPFSDPKTAWKWEIND